MKYFVEVNGAEHVVELTEVLGELRVAYDGAPLTVRYEEVDRLGQAALYLGGEGGASGDKAYAISIEGSAAEVRVTVAGHLYQVALEDERERAAHDAEKTRKKGGGELKSIMPGVVVKLLVKVGDAVEKDQPLLILEAMKMQNEIGSPITGTVSALFVREGEAVASGAKLASLSAAG
ncbi:MAG: biotin/lipoyl-binding protein [Planctomycetes bacterium]|nr:biotin/lipoyl-binding protein [Planctomycetota bacterium]